MKYVHEKLDRVLEAFDSLRHYLYEIDPQFDDERALYQGLDESVADGSFSLDGMHLIDLRKKKKEEGKRTLDTPF